MRRPRHDPAFRSEMEFHLTHYVGRPSPLYFAERMTAHCGGAKIYFKREDLNHTGAHKVNNVLGQIMLARRESLPLTDSLYQRVLFTQNLEIVQERRRLARAATGHRAGRRHWHPRAVPAFAT